MFEVGATYSRKRDIHAKFRGQQQGGISTPKATDLIFLFTGEAGEKHGYHDEYAEDGFHLYGEGQLGPMKYTHGNLAVRDHARNGKKLLLFQALGKGKPCVYRGEYALVRHYERNGVPDTKGNPRTAIVFVLKRVAFDEAAAYERAAAELTFEGADLSETTKEIITRVRTKQVLFRDRLELVEKGCRVTGITDGRFLRASHIKPWSKCDEGTERIDGYNGLLLAHHVDHLFDQGWLTFEDNGTPIFSEFLPWHVVESLGLATVRTQGLLPFNERQAKYLDYHRSNVFRRTDPNLQ